MPKLRFKIDPRITDILGESYRSSEQAIKELVDNAWDADATEVHISLPEPMTDQPVTIEDNGSGMTSAEVEQEYLHVARNRRTKRGDRTPKLNRLVKGRKGVGKFAGLMVADLMEVVTKARGKESSLRLRKSELLEFEGDLEYFDIPIEEREVADSGTGTRIELQDLSQNLTFPNPDKLRSLLAREYGRENDLGIIVNGQRLGVEDYPGESFTQIVPLPSGGVLRFRFVVAEGKKRVGDPGISVRVDGKTVGNPQFLGLERDEMLPRDLIRKLYGEVEIEGAGFDCVTADGGGFIENHTIYQELCSIGASILRDGLEKARGKEVAAAKARYQKLINRKLEQLPEYRRVYAGKALDRVLQRFYLEGEEKFGAIISVVLDALERTEYWEVMQHLNEARHGDVENLAEALTEFGIRDLAIVGNQAHHRRAVLDDFQQLVENPQTQEKQIHKALESNLWILDIHGTLLSSNESLKRIVEKYLDGEYQGTRATKRPDLLLAHDVAGNNTLVELKRPSHTIDRTDEAQAMTYRDELRNSLDKISILLLGKDKDAAMSSINEREHVTVMSYMELISKARSRVEWLINELKLAE